MNCCSHKKTIKHGRFKRKSDSQWVQRYRCKSCGKLYSQATDDAAKYQKKRHLNHAVLQCLASNVSMRRTALILNIHPITVARKLEYLSQQCQAKLDKQWASYKGIKQVQFDELQTIEHSKCKPLSVAMAVSEKSRKILGFQVSKMPATGHLAKIARQKYGYRKDERMAGLQKLFEGLSSFLDPDIRIKSDEAPTYGSIVHRYFPKASYHVFKGAKSAVAGQGELKKLVNDPLFEINHTFAMLRANINRLIRRTWCTTKKISRLIDHLTIYVWFHNTRLT